MSQVKQIFNEALELEPDEREKFLAQACGADAGLRDEVESLLDSYNRVEDFLQTPAASFSASEMAAQVLESEEASAIGKLVGAYKIEREIGRGGMGAVYLATRDDGQFHKKVAIKLLRRGMENESVIRRFQNERQILADLEHPNIARLIDGGATENGLPYFVMEYVAGLPVNRFCDERNLSIEERLKLFREICAAVEFAHEHSIIHRDIKPSNIFVTKTGTPKLLDFGIAKTSATNGKLASTVTALRAMTPEYASPEQMRGERVTKASDIYSLGVLLYELVTGHRPYNFDSKSPYEIVQAICEEEPIRPSLAVSSNFQVGKPPIANRKSFKNDLDNIILKSLRKEPKRRYTSVREFSEDIRRLLEGSPVSARQDTVFYRGAKLFERYRTSVLSAVAVTFVFLLIGFSLNFYSGRADLRESSSSKSPDNAIPNSITERQRSGTVNAEAYNLYLKGQHLWNQRSVETHLQAADLFQQAVEKDPEYALAYSGLANSYSLLSVWSNMPPKEAFPKARAAAEKAVALDPDLAEGHLSLAMVFWLYEWNWQAADREFKRAIELDSNYTLAPHWYGLFLAEMGRFEEAVAAENRALEIEPLSIPINADLARVLFYARRYKESAAQYRKTIELNPNFKAFYAELFELYEAARMTREWYDLMQQTDSFKDAALKKAFQTEGLDGYRRKAFKLYSKTKVSEWHHYFTRAQDYALLDKKDKAFELLNQAFEARDHRMAQIKVHPKLDNLRSDSRFIELLKRMNLDN
jgi:serine/threonine protein kinase